MTRSWRRLLRGRAAARPPRVDSTVAPQPSLAQAYGVLTERIVTARANVRREQQQSKSLVEQRADHQLLTTLLNDAVTQAFVADAVDAPKPPGVTRWAAEGLARSTEREFAVFAALDLG